MNIKQIKAKALKENLNITPYIKKIQKKRREYPLGTDITIHDMFIPQVIHYCDTNNIPIYEVATNCCSTAGTYSALLAYENLR